jgi:hypothetical protein
MVGGIFWKNIGLCAVSVILITYYRIEVCPFLEQIDVTELIVEMTLRSS